MNSELYIARGGEAVSAPSDVPGPWDNLVHPLAMRAFESAVSH